MDLDSTFDCSCLDKQFDEQLKSVDSLKWLPWVGDLYNQSLDNKLMILGESHYHWGKPDASERLEQNSFTREMVGISHALNPKSKVKFYRNLERAIFQVKKPSTQATKYLWRSVCFHNLVLTPMSNKLKRPSKNDYVKGWKSLLNMTQVLKPDQCIFAGTDWQKIDAFSEAIQSLGYTKESNLKAIKLGRSKGRRFIVTSPEGHSFSIVFIKHPSSFFNWTQWGEFLKAQISAIPELHNRILINAV